MRPYLKISRARGLVQVAECLEWQAQGPEFQTPIAPKKGKKKKNGEN
jgi:hypothetical protein